MDFFIVAELRNDIGKYSNFKLRKNKKVPAVIYFSGMSIPIFFDLLYVAELMRRISQGNNLLEVRVNDNKYNVIIKDFYKHPFKNDILHFDFQKVELNDFVTSKVFFNFIGEKNAVGIRHGGFLIKHKLFVDLNCLVSKLPNFIDVDISNLGVNESMFLSDLNIDDSIKMSVLSNKNKSKILIASIIGSRALEQKTQDVKAK